jgi:hypothetical protein
MRMKRSGHRVGPRDGTSNRAVGDILDAKMMAGRSTGCGTIWTALGAAAAPPAVTGMRLRIGGVTARRAAPWIRTHSFSIRKIPGTTLIDVRAGACPTPGLTKRSADRSRIFIDRAVGGKPSHAGDIAQAGPPIVGLALARDRALRLPVGVEIGDDHILVGPTQPIGQQPEAIRLVGRKIPLRSSRLPLSAGEGPRTAVERGRGSAPRRSVGRTRLWRRIGRGFHIGAVERPMVRAPLMRVS